MNIFPRLEILRTLKGLLKEDCQHVFYSDRPDAVDEAMKSFIVVRESDVRDRNALTDCNINIYLFVRDKQSLEDTVEMEKILCGILGHFPCNIKREKDNGWLIFSTPDVVGGRTDGNGFHCVTIDLSLTIY